MLTRSHWEKFSETITHKNWVGMKGIYKDSDQRAQYLEAVGGFGGD